MTQSDKQRFLTNAAFLAVIFLIAYLIIRYLAIWMMPFILGLIMAMILQRPVNWVLRKTGLKRKFVAPAATLILVLLFVAIVILCLISGVSEAMKLASTLPGFVQSTVPKVVAAISQRMETMIQALPAEWETQVRVIIQDGLKALQNQAVSLSAAALPWIAGFAADLPSLLIRFIITVVATFFFCADYEKVKAFVWRQVPQRYQTLAGETWSTFAHTLAQMIRSYLLLMLITFLELSLGLFLLGVNHFLLLGALIAVVDIFPVLGTGTILIPWGLLAIIMGNLAMGVGILLLYIVVTVIRNILEPRIVGKRIGVHPLVTLMLMYLGLHVVGLPGLFLFPLAFILLKNAQAAGMLHLWKE